jgi:hypothetical protein
MLPSVHRDGAELNVTHERLRRSNHPLPKIVSFAPLGSLHLVIDDGVRLVGFLLPQNRLGDHGAHPDEVVHESCNLLLELSILLFEDIGSGLERLHRILLALAAPIGS